MKNLRLLLVSLTLLLAGALGAEAKEKQSTLDILTSTIWGHDCGKHCDAIGDAIFFTFEKGTGKQLIYWKGMKMADATFTYYLSDEPVTKYNKKKEGKVKNGKYIIIVYTGFGDSPMSEILKKQGKDPNKPTPPASHEIIGISAQEFSLPSVGVDGTFVPCSDLAAEEKRLDTIMQKIKSQEQQSKQPTDKPQPNRQPVRK